MTIGIYKLTFKDLEDWPYVGQSLNIEQRYKVHCSCLKHGRSNFMMLEAYEITKEFPTLHILKECEVSELNALEIQFINQLDSYNNGLNLTDKETNNSYGELNFHSKTSNEKAINILLCAYNNPKMLLTDIVKKYDTTISVVTSIVRGNNYKWLQEVLPKEYDEVLSQSRLGNWTAENQGIDYPLIKDPLGNVYKITNLQQFARDHKLDNSSLHQVLVGKRKTVHKWRLA